MLRTVWAVSEIPTNLKDSLINLFPVKNRRRFLQSVRIILQHRSLCENFSLWKFSTPSKQISPDFVHRETLKFSHRTSGNLDFSLLHTNCESQFVRLNSPIRSNWEWNSDYFARLPKVLHFSVLDRSDKIKKQHALFWSETTVRTFLTGALVRSNVFLFLWMWLGVFQPYFRIGISVCSAKTELTVSNAPD